MGLRSSTEGGSRNSSEPPSPGVVLLSSPEKGPEEEPFVRGPRSSIGAPRAPILRPTTSSSAGMANRELGPVGGDVEGEREGLGLAVREEDGVGDAVGDGGGADGEEGARGDGRADALEDGEVVLEGVHRGGRAR